MRGKKERPVRLRAYQAGLWGCLTNPGRVGGLGGSANGYRSSCCSSYQNLNSSESCRQGSDYLESGALLTGLARGAISTSSPFCVHPGAPSRPLTRDRSAPSRRMPPRFGGTTDRIPELPLALDQGRLHFFLTNDTLLYSSVKANGAFGTFYYIYVNILAIWSKGGPA